MADKKAERLINLTLALLSTRRYLKKSEIFATVVGYSGNSESMDRMFERDKNELRSLGIDITVGDLDPLFDDEPGYRIFRDSYSFQLKNLEPTDVAILSVASKLWNDSILSTDAQGCLIKLESLGLADSTTEPLVFSYRYENPTSNLIALENAITDLKTIAFKYKEASQSREVEPYKIYLWRGFWYFIGRDIAKDSIRSFKLSRVNGEVELTKRKFKAPEKFSISDHIAEPESHKVTLRIPEGKAVILANMGQLVSSESGFDIFEIDFHDENFAVRQLLKYGSDVEVISPDNLNKAIKDRLQRLINV